MSKLKISGKGTFADPLKISLDGKNVAPEIWIEVNDFDPVYGTSNWIDVKIIDVNNWGILLQRSDGIGKPTFDCTAPFVVHLDTDFRWEEEE